MSDEELDAFVSAGRHAYPELELGREDFALYLAQRREAPLDLAADLYLACACKAQVPGAIDAFQRRYRGAYRAVFDKMGLAGVADDLAQLLLERLFIKGTIKNYKGSGALGKWVRVLAAREGHHHLKRDKKHREGRAAEDRIVEAIGAADPEMLRLKSAYRARFKEAFAAAFGQLSDRERNIYRMQYLDGLNLERMAAIYNVSRATVARWRTAARTSMMELTRARLAKDLNLSSTRDMESIMRFIDSELEVSLTRLLREKR